MKYIVLAIQRIFLTFDTSDPKTAAAPLKVLQNFYMDHEKAVEMTIRSISLPMIRFIYLKGIRNTDGPVSEEIAKSGLRFLSCVGSHFDLIVEEVSKAISTASESELITYCGIIRFIKDCFSNPDLSIPQLRVEVKLLEGLTSFLVRVQITDIIDSYISNDYERIKLTLKVLEIFAEIMDYLYSEGRKWSREELSKMIESIPSISSALENYEKDFIDLCKVLCTFKIQDNYIIFKDRTGTEQALFEELHPLLIRALRYAVMAVVIMQKVIYTTKSSDTVSYPAWMKALVSCIQSNEPNICRVSIEGLIYVISADRKEKIFVRLRDVIKSSAGRPD